MQLLADAKLQLVAGILVLTLLCSLLLRSLHRRFALQIEGQAIDPADRKLSRQLLGMALGPLCLLVWYYGLLAAAYFWVGDHGPGDEWRWVNDLMNRVSGIGVFIAGLWFFWGAARVLDRYFCVYAEKTESRWDDVLLPVLGLGLRLMVPVFALMLFAHLWPISGEALVLLRKLLAIALIGAATWLMRRAVLLTETTILREKDVTLAGNYRVRELATRIKVMRKIAMVLITVFAFSAVLMLFEEVRDVGKSILASAGIAGIILGLAAQRSLGNLFAGLQMAMTQPVRIGDMVNVQNEVGTVEEITLTYVVVRTWDLRRLILPLSFFIEQPVQNWTRDSANLLSPVTIRVDFSFPVDELRTHMKGVIEKSTYWDKLVFGVQVTNADQYTMEIRILGSSDSPGNSFNLQCELREKAIVFVQRNYPQCLPKYRQERKAMETWEGGAVRQGEKGGELT